MSAPGDATAVILARGGSKGLARKNILPIGGRPCIEWTIDQAIAAGTIGPIIVSSDDAEILALAAAWADRTGGRIRPHARPPELATDTATIDAAARSAVAGVAPRLRAPVVVLYANVPVRPPGLIDRAVRLLLESGADSVQSYAPVGKFHPWWTARIDADTGSVRPWEGTILNNGVFRRQDLPPAFIPDGGVIAVTREALMLEIPGVSPGPHAFFGRDDRRRGVINPEGSVVDVDTMTDLLVAEAVLTRAGADRALAHRGTP